MNNEIAYMQSYYSQVVKKKKIFNFVIVCEEKKTVRERGEREEYFLLFN